MSDLLDIIGYIYNLVAVKPDADMSTNLALGKTTKQSSTFSGHSSSNAVDGNRDNTLQGNSCAHTMGQRGPWWQVDLDAVYEIRQVVIKSRGDCCGQFIYGVVNNCCSSLFYIWRSIIIICIFVAGVKCICCFLLIIIWVNW